MKRIVALVTGSNRGIGKSCIEEFAKAGVDVVINYCHHKAEAEKLEKYISETYNVSPNVINRLLKKFGIKIRDCSESKFGLLTGEKHPNWKGGVTTLYSKLRQFFKTRQTHTTLERDGYKCSMCGDDKNLQVHHIKYFKDIFN